MADSVNIADKGGIEQALDSRYSGTPVLMDSLGRIFYDVWRPPKLRLRNTVRTFQVSEDVEFAYDLISNRMYGDSTKFWAIALPDDRIFNVVRDLVPGMSLTVPNMKDVAASLITADRTT